MYRCGNNNKTKAVMQKKGKIKQKSKQEAIKKWQLLATYFCPAFFTPVSLFQGEKLSRIYLRHFTHLFV